MVSVTPNKGFSLIELLIVCSVIIGLTGLAISNYSSFTDTQKIRQAGKTLKNDLRFIQTRSASGLKPSTCNDSNPLASYRISFTANTYTYQAICISGPAGDIKTITLQTGVQFAPIPTAFEFQVLTGAVTSTQSFPLNLTLTNTSKTYRISVSQNGDLNDLGYIQPTPTP